MLELDAIFLFEASPRILEYREQPITIIYPDGPRLRRYTPDFELTLCTGEGVLIEVKPRSRLVDAAIQHKLNCITTYLRRSGKRFVILDDTTLRLEPRQSNLRDIYHRASRVRQTMAAYRAALDRYASQFPLSISSALRIFGNSKIDPYSMLLVGLLHCDLEQPITHDTPLHLTKEGDDAWFCITPGYDF
nr:TnsA endonuclease N-terminal domain-containing protein [Cupriavidus taiwanensis]